MAHKKGVGSSKNGRESHAQRLGVKIWGGQQITAGNIIVRQRGTKHNPGLGVAKGKDDTLYALIDGIVCFRKTRNNKSIVSVLPLSAVKTEKKEEPKKVEETVVTEEPKAEVKETKAAPKKATAKPAEEKKATAAKKTTTAKKPAAAKKTTAKKEN